MSVVAPQLSYPFVGTLLLDLWQAGELPMVRDVLIEPRYGHVARVLYDNGSVRMVRNGRVGVNSNSASEVAKDKAYTKFFLRELGYNTPAGDLILMPKYREQIAETLKKREPSALHLHELDGAIQAHYGYPCYLKSNNGSQGKHVHQCHDWADVKDILALFERDNVQMFVMEQAIPYDDYRVVVWQDRVIACYRRVPLKVVGDGISSVEQLIEAKQHALREAGRDVTLQPDDLRITTMLKRQNYALQSIVPAGDICVLADVANLSIGGDAEDWTTRMHPFWQELCIRITHDLGMNLCGVDLACADLTNPDARYSIFEVNAAPGMEHYAAMGFEQRDRVRALYREIFSQYPA